MSMSFFIHYRVIRPVGVVNSVLEFDIHSIEHILEETTVWGWVPYWNMVSNLIKTEDVYSVALTFLLIQELGGLDRGTMFEVLWSKNVETFKLTEEQINRLKKKFDWL